ACATARGGAPPPGEAIARVLAAAPLDQVHWGLLAVDAASGRILQERASARKFVPASNMKLLVTTAALERLGPDYRFRTALWAAGTMEDGGVLDGDLVLAASGDPTLSERFWPSDEAPLEALADSLLAHGIRVVRGGLVVDASAWDSTTVAGTWMVGNLPGRSSATGGAFAVAEGEASIVVKGGAVPGEPASVTWTPLGEPDFVESRAETVSPDSAGDLDVAYLPESRRLVVTGRVPADSTEVARVSVRDPVRQAAAALHRTLEERGVTVAGGWSVAWDEDEPVGGGCRSGGVPACAGAREVAALEAPPLLEVVEGILEPSQNWMTEQLVRTLGISDSTRAGWRPGLRAVEDFMVQTVGVDSLDLSLRDGSGLSAYNLVTPRALVRLLRWVREQDWGAGYRTAMAEPGEEDSTLESRFPELQGRLYAKTGTISNVNSLTGYLVADSGREIVFSLLSNGSGLPSGTVRAGMDEVVRILARGY
ncbi:MAG TPA: D-alanyl-D-alanine carboxypeptidase/D-alanyl-D-alanine-endopeptidase, partial [Actinomycetota bacterium]|nr:D-alanyl-D-alanine carboxypeptidase/D-alanyl-D-alanine-endopeptidase [Actinomycetota bacterium]